MSREIENQLKRCFRLLAKIKEEYPEDDFDREMLHGDMDFRYRQIKEDREELEAFPPIVREFARFKDTLSIPDEAVKTFFRAIMKEPEPFAALQTIEFQKRKEKIEVWAAELGTGAANINQLLTRARLSGILDADCKINERYNEVISVFLTM
jgi:hypothetical protein